MSGAALALFGAVLALGPSAVSGASASAASAASAHVVRVKPRPELPWVTAVVAVPGTGSPSALATCSDARRPEVLSLVAAGGSVRATPVDLLAWRGFLAEAEGPPEAEALVVAAVKSCGRGPLFVEGRTRRADAGRLAAPPPSTRAAWLPTKDLPREATTRLLLAPAPALFDLEGAALELLVEDALRGVAELPGDVAGSVRVDGHAGATWLEVARLEPAQAAAARVALENLVAAPLPPRGADALALRAAGRLAFRRAEAGGWARDMARLWLAFGTVDVEAPDALSLAVRARARLFPSLLFPEVSGASSPAPSRAR